jgi:hypothetical protein
MQRHADAAGKGAEENYFFHDGADVFRDGADICISKVKDFFVRGNLFSHNIFGNIRADSDSYKNPGKHDKQDKGDDKSENFPIFYPQTNNNATSCQP